MPKSNRPKTHGFYQLGKQFIDSFSLAAALLWLGLMIGFAWWKGDIPLLTSVARAIVGSIFVYFVVFVGLHVVIRAANKSIHKGRAAKSKKPPENAEHFPDELRVEATEQQG